MSADRSELDFIKIRNHDVPIRRALLDQRTLNFFPDNPRIYSLLRVDDKEPDQDEIYKQLIEHEHVRTLIADIKMHGGLIDQIIVRDGSLEVLEGNSRLAAYRFLAKKDPIKWAKIKCTILPKNIDPKLIFALLGQYHVKGKKDWLPYERAGYLHRRFREQKIDKATIATELGIPRGEVDHSIHVYEFMQKHKQGRDRWSYYDEYLKSKKIKKARDICPDFDNKIVSMIEKGEVKRAVDIRDDLPVICSGPGRNLKKFAEGKVSFDDAHDVAYEAGGDNPAYKQLNKFRDWLSDPDTEKELAEAAPHVLDKIEYELGQIERIARKLKKSVDI